MRCASCNQPLYTHELLREGDVKYCDGCGQRGVARWAYLTNPRKWIADLLGLPTPGQAWARWLKAQGRA